MPNKSLSIKTITPVENNGVLVYRVVNFSPGGYIIVAGQMNVKPILGYGFDSNLDLKNAAPGLKFLLSEFSKEIYFASKNKIEVNSLFKENWERYSAKEFVVEKSYTVGSYLLETIWGQGSHHNYNAQCPYYPGTSTRCAAGCNAVALAQILKYWGCLVFPDSTNTYTPENFTTSLTVNFYDQDYDWDAMDDDGPDADNTELIYHCGVACELDYRISGTTGFFYKIEDAMENYFGFETVGLKYKNNYLTTTAWINVLKADIDAERPICYAGVDDDDGGHSWVIDGYNSSNYFHCNWGWADYNNENGFYALTALDPDIPNTNYAFTSTQQAVIGAEPILDACSGLEGSDVVCSENESYSVSIPTLASVVWSKSSNLDQVGGNTGTTYTVNEGSSGTSATGTVTATIKNSHNQTFLTRTKTVWVGVPDPDDFEVYIEELGGSGVPGSPDGPFELCEGEQYWVCLYPDFLFDDQGIEDVEFDFTFDYDVLDEGDDYIEIEVNSSPEDEEGEVYITSKCNDYYTLKFMDFEEGNCSKRSLKFTPNPTTGETILSIETTSEKFDEILEWEFEIYGSGQLLHEKKTKLTGSGYKIRTAGWNEGVYTVRVNYKNEILTGKLVVKK